MITITVGLPLRFVLLSLDIFTDDICVYFMILGAQSDSLYLTFFGGCHRCFSRLWFGGQGMESEERSGGGRIGGSDGDEQKEEMTSESGDVASDVLLI